MNKLPISTKVFNLKKLLLQAETSGWPISAEDIKHAFIFKNIEEVFDSTLTDKVLVAQSARAMEVTDSLRQIFDEWGQAEEAVSNLALYLTRLYPSLNGKPLLDVCIKSGVDHYQKVSLKMFNEDDINLPKQLQSFIVGLTRPIPELLGHSLFAEIGDDDWMAWPAMTVPIFDWIKLNNFQRLLLVPVSEISNEDALLIRIQVTHSIFSYQDLKRARLDWKQIIQQETFN